jgi:biopolymer transport protein TolR
VPLNRLAASVRELQGNAAAGTDATPVVISADKSVKYETVVKVMDTLQRAGVTRVGLSVQTTR